MCDRHPQDEVDLDVLIDGTWKPGHLVRVQEADRVWGEVEIVACWIDDRGRQEAPFAVGHVRFREDATGAAASPSTDRETSGA